MRGVTFNNGVTFWHNPFQLTRLMRGVTKATMQTQQNEFDFNSHASCEA